MGYEFMSKSKFRGCQEKCKLQTSLQVPSTGGRWVAILQKRQFPDFKLQEIDIDL